MKVKDVIKLIENDGWFQVAQKGSHRQFKHPVKQGRVTIAGKLSGMSSEAAPAPAPKDMPQGTLNSVLKQAQLKGIDNG